MDLEDAYERLTAIESELAQLDQHVDEIDSQFEVVHDWEGISQEISLARLRIRDAMDIIEQERRLRGE